MVAARTDKMDAPLDNRAGFLPQTANPSRLERVFTAYVVFIPIFVYYKSPVPGLNLATFLALCFLGWFLLARPKPTKPRQRLLFPVWLYLGFLTFNVVSTSYLYNYPILDPHLLEYVRALLLVLSILVLGARFFDFPLAMSILEKLLLASILWMLVQLVFAHVLGHPITGNIPALVTNEGYRIARERPTGFYMEPSEFAKNAIMYLCFTLFGTKSLPRRETRKVLAIVGGIALSGSGMGYAFLALGFVVWILYNVFFTAMTSGKLVGGMALIVLLLAGSWAFLQTSMGQYAFSRIVSEDGDGRLGYWGGQALSGRTYTNEMFNDLSDVQKFWGVGFGHGSDVLGNYYRNSWTSHLVACGYLSIPVWLVIVSSVFLRGDMRFKVFAVIFALLYCISASATVTGFSYFFSFLLSGCTLPPPHRETER